MAPLPPSRRRNMRPSGRFLVPRLRIDAACQWVAVVVLAASVTPGRAAPVPAEQWRQEAQTFERQGQWEKACESYVRLLAEDRQHPELRARLRHCVRRLQQVRRHRDPVYRARVLALPMSQALALYMEVLSKLHGQYA